MKDKLIKIKRSRMKPEELFLIDILNYITIKEQTKNITIWEKDGQILFTQDFKNGWLWVSYKIWDRIREFFDDDYSKTHFSIKKIVKDYLNWDNLEPLRKSKTKHER